MAILIGMKAMNKNQLIVAWAILFFSVLPLFAQDKHPVDKFDERIIQDIQKKCASIDAIKSYRKIERDIDGKSTEGGALVYYLQDGIIRKIVETLYFESGKNIDEYYFWKDSLIFVFNKKLYYDLPINVAPEEEIGKVGKTEENRYYFHNGNLIRWLDKNSRLVSADNPEYKKKEYSLNGDAEKFIKEFEPFPQNKGSIYEYDDPPDVCFFPVDKARWGGYKVTIGDWEKLTDFQKTMFVSEAVEEIKRNEKGKVAVDVYNEGWTILGALNQGVSYLKAESSNLDMPMIRFLRDLLKETGKIE
jgi:hypothetical protein